LFSRPSGDRELGVDPATGRTIVAKAGRYGPYVTEILPDDVPKTGKNAVKPRTGSLFKDMSLDDIDLDTALKLMSLPRVVGADPETGEEITAQNGRYGPYLKRGTDSRSLGSEDQIFTVTLDEALAIYAQPKARGGRGTAKPPLREFGADPVSGKPITVKDGRFGPYITDGETNITVPRGTTIEELTEERAIELLAEKRAKGPAPKKKSAAKKTAAPKKAAAKTASKTAAKKATAKKTAATSSASNSGTS
jgi:DNA topoisomerase I